MEVLNRSVADGEQGPHPRVLEQTARYEPTIKPTTKVDTLQRRLNTYSGWSSKQSSVPLATAGFTYTGITDKVECQSCGIRLYNWQEDEDPLQAHKKYAPDCDFMSKNFPNVKAPAKPMKPLSVKYQRYSDYNERLKSFDSWPLKCVAQKAEIMAKCGFFYIGSADRARCFYCGVTLRDWDTDDYPPCAHKQWSDKCPFVEQLDVEGIKQEIEELERQEKREKVKDEQFHLHFIDCSSSRKLTNDLVIDGVPAVTSSAQVYAQVSDVSTDSIAFNPAIQAVVEMGYTHDVIEKALEIRRQEGLTDPNAVSLFEAIMDMGL